MQQLNVGFNVMWGLAPSPHSTGLPASDLRWTLRFGVSVLLSGYSSFLPQSKNSHVRLTVDYWE